MKKIVFALFTISALSSCEFKVKVNNKDDTQATATSQTLDSVKTLPANLPFPLKTGFTNDYLKATFWKCNYSSAGASHAYWVILPNTLRPTKVEPEVIKGLTLTSIGTYSTIDKTLPYIEVQVGYETLKDITDPSAWLLEKIKLMGESILNKNEFQYEDGQKNLDLLTYKVIPGGEKVVSRFVGQKNGNDYYFIKAACNEKDYTAQANTVFHTVSHWGLKK